MTDAPFVPPAAAAVQPRPYLSSWAGPVRTGSIIVLGGLLAGLVMGILWWWISPPLWLIVRKDGAYPEASAQDRWFSADGWFLVLGIALGFVLAVAAWWRGRRHPVGALLGITIGGLLAAATAWWLGGLLGPGDPATLIDTAQDGSRLEQALGLRAMAVLLAPAITGLATFVALAAAARPEGPGDTLQP